MDFAKNLEDNKLCLEEKEPWDNSDIENWEVKDPEQHLAGINAIIIIKKVLTINKEDAIEEHYNLEEEEKTFVFMSRAENQKVDPN